MPRTFKSGARRFSQRGFSLIELSIAVLIALFLLGGLVTLVQGFRRANGTQTALSQLQDNERIAMTLITNVVQKAGYFPNPVLQQLTNFTAETLDGVTVASRQVIGGIDNAAGDTFLVRFYAPASDTNNAIINCAGQSNATASTTIWYTNVFTLGTVNGTKWLQCQTRTSGAGAILTVNLIPNVSNIQVLYGVSPNNGTDDYSVVQYLTATQMSATSWLNVSAVKVILTFLVPKYGTTGGQMSTTTATIQRVIPLMSRAGVDI
jgi:type IV pilus assembly protein PilW